MTRLQSAAETDRAAGSLTRDHAASLLREAGNTDLLESTDPIDWAHAALPHSRAATRLKVRSLLAHGDTEAADALLAVALLRRPTDPSLSLHSAESLFVQARFESADRIMRLILPRRPRHVATLVLAGRVAAALGQHVRAIDLLQCAHRRQPDRHDVAELIIESHLAIGAIDQAATLLEAWPESPPLLRARLFVLRDRPLQAIAVLDAALARSDDDRERDRLLNELVTQLDRTDQGARLRRISDGVDTATPLAVVALARALLARGDFEHILNLIDRLPVVSRRCSPALEVAIVAAAMIGQSDRAERAIIDHEREPYRLDRRSLAGCWRRGLLGRLLRAHAASASAQADPNPGLLRGFTRRALATFDQAAESGGTYPSGMGLVEQHRTVCRALLATDSLPVTPA